MDSIQLKTFNRFGVAAKKISNHYLCEPYSVLMHYKRTFKFLKGLSEQSASAALILGNKNQITLNWNQAIKKVDTGALQAGRVNQTLLTIGMSKWVNV